jgi:hypothetical protein
VGYHGVLRAYQAAPDSPERDAGLYEWYDRMQREGVRVTPEMERVVVMMALQVTRRSPPCFRRRTHPTANFQQR